MSELRVLSWNVNGLETSRLDSRMERLATEVLLGVRLQDALAGHSRPMPDVVCLQEVVKRAQLAKIGPHFTAAGFVMHPPQPARDDGDYSLIALRPPWRLEQVETRELEESPLGRTLIEAQLAHEDGTRVSVLTAHLESLRSGSEARVAQCLEIDGRLRSSPHPALFAGDTNLRADEWSRARTAGALMKDAFELAGEPRLHRHTWWPEGSERGFRFDRIWLDAQHGWQVELTTRRRDTLSDHAAIEALLRF